MMRILTILAVLLTLSVAPRPSAAETEWVLILDNSTSMSKGSFTPPSTEITTPPADPHRVAIIATLIFRAFLDADDRLTILTFRCCDPYPVLQGQPFNKIIGLFRVLPNTIQDIRDLWFSEITPFTGPMKEARRLLEASAAPRKVLVLVTDGAPTDDDPLTADDAKRLLGLGADPPPFEVISLAIAPDEHTGRKQVEFLGPLGKLEQAKNPAELIAGFTRVYADNIRSRPESGTLPPGGSYEFRAPKYVSEVLVALASVNRMGTFAATLSVDGKDVPAVDAGDSGCTKFAREHKDSRTPCHAYQVFKAKKDVSAEQKWTLASPGIKGPVAYGIILRYDLGAEILSMSEAKAGEQKEVIARLTFKGQAFNDAAFFSSDGFEAHAVIGGVEAPLTLRPEDGSFAGKIEVPKAGGNIMTVRFRNKWLTVTAARPFHAEAWMPLELDVTPAPIDLGTWTGERADSERCVELDFTRSLNADKVALEIFAKQLPDGLTLRAPSGPAAGNKARVCIVAPGCCDAYSAPANAVVVVRGEHAHYHAGAIEIPLRFAIEPTPFLTCWWRVIAGAIGTIVFLLIVYGFVKPFDFDAQEVIKLSGKENTLSRAAGRRLRELPGGRRGFYRDARVAFDGSGGATKPGAAAALMFKATRSDAVIVSKAPIENKDPRTRKWTAVDASNGPIYLRRAVVYRVGEIYFQLG